MRNFIRIIYCLLFAVMVTACKDIDDFLDKAPGVDITEDVLFTTRAQAETVVAAIYRMGIPSPYPMNEGVDVGYGRPQTSNAGITDEALNEQAWAHPSAWNDGSVSANTSSNGVGSEDHRFGVRWTCIRYCNIILERADEIPDAEQRYKDQIKGEAHFIRALAYFELVKRYGGVPIIPERFQLTDDFELPRNTVREVFDFITEDVNAAIDLLPSTYPGNLRGRATRTAARLLKSRALLYAASPLFNADAPYLTLGESSQDELLFMGNKDNARWQLAADAAKEAIDSIAHSQFGLINDQGVDRNYKYVWEKLDNKEVILANKVAGSKGGWDYPWVGLAPAWSTNSWGIAPGILLNFIMKYEDQTGATISWNGGNDLIAKYESLDPRFKQTVAYTSGYYNEDNKILEIFEGGKHKSVHRNTGAWLKKLIPDTYRGSTGGHIPNGIVFRVAEAYLNLAEALNEAQGPADAYQYVNLIRARSGMPPLPGGLTQEQFRSRVRNERDIELAFEDHRLWDIRRWKIAEEDGVMQGEFWGMTINKIPNTTEYSYTPIIVQRRQFLRRMYLHPFPQGEINKGYIIQNPGY